MEFFVREPRLLPWENAEEFFEMRAQLILDLRPEGQREWFLVNRIVNLQWRLVRTETWETAVFAYRVMSVAGHVPSPYHKPVGEFEVPRSSQDESSDAQPAEMERPFQPTIIELGKAYMLDVEEGEVLSKLRRHETSLENSLRKAIQDLEQLQARRMAARLTHPATIEVENSAGEAPGSDFKDRAAPLNVPLT